MWSIHILNRSPTFAVQNMTPSEALNGYKPVVDHFRVFGCIAYARIPDAKRSKLDNKGGKCIFHNINDYSKAYKLYNPITKKIIISQDIVFNKDLTWPWSNNVADKMIRTSFKDEDEGSKQQSARNVIQPLSRNQSQAPENSQSLGIDEPHDEEHSNAHSQ